MAEVKSLWEQIPLYINGSLAAADRKTFEHALKQNSALKQEYLEFHEIETFFDHSEDVSQQHFDMLFTKILSNVEKVEQNPESIHLNPDDASQVKQTTSDILSSPRVGWTFAIVQLVMLIVVIVYFSMTVSHSPSMLPVLDTAPIVSSNNTINVVFADDATQKQIRELMIKLKAQIVSGPTKEGLYSIVVKGDKRKLKRGLNHLKKSSLILLAEPGFI